MASDSSFTDSDGPPPSSHERQLDKQLLRHLLSRYSDDELARLMQEERLSANSNGDGASVVTSSTFSSVKSEEAPSLFDSASSVCTSDTSSTRNSIISNVSARTAKFLRKGQSQSSTCSDGQSIRPSTEASWDQPDGSDIQSIEDVGPAIHHSLRQPKQKGTFSCGFCKEEMIQKSCTRKNDLKRHIEDFHNADSQWFCRHRGCGMVFDWQTAYKTHLKHAHGGSRTSLDEGKVELCPQTVFACGFERCEQVFESPSDAEAAATFKDFVAHVVKHFDEGINSGEWTYSARIRNLMRQSSVLRAWNNSSWSEEERGRLVWQPQSSRILRKKLETRHIGDLQLLIQYAIALGSDPSSVQNFRQDFVIPIRAQCQASIQGHKLGPPPQIPTSPAPPVTPEANPFQFKISRNNDPGLAAFLASQRRVYATQRPMVRAGRSARPPTHAGARPSHGTAGPMVTPYNYQHSQSSMFDLRNPQNFNMIAQQGNGGIIADDMRNLQSLADGTTGNDIDMADARLADAMFMPQQHQGFPTTFEANGTTSPSSGISGAMMDQQDNYSAFTASHAY